MYSNWSSSNVNPAASVGAGASSSSSAPNSSGHHGSSNNNCSRSNVSANADPTATTTTPSPQSPPSVIGETTGFGLSNISKPTLAAINAVANALDVSPIKKLLAKAGERVRFPISIKLSIASKAYCTGIDLSSVLLSLPEHVIADFPISVEDLSLNKTFDASFGFKTGSAVIATVAIRSHESAVASINPQQQKQGLAHSSFQNPTGADVLRTRWPPPASWFRRPAPSEQHHHIYGLKLSYSEADLWQMEPHQRRKVKLFLQDTEKKLQEQMSTLADMQASQKRQNVLQQMRLRQQQLWQQHPFHQVAVHHQQQHFAPQPHQESYTPSSHALDKLAVGPRQPPYSSFNSNGNGAMQGMPRKKRDHEKKTAKKRKTDTSESEFFERLHFLLLEAQRTKQDDIIMWLPCGKVFRVLDRRRLEGEVLPRHFISITWRAFTAQLRLHSFTFHEYDAFSHPCFLRDNPFIIHKMVGRRIETQTSQGKNASGRMRDKEETKVSKKKAYKASVVNNALFVSQEKLQSQSVDNFPTPDTVEDQQFMDRAASLACGPEVSKNVIDERKPAAGHDTIVDYNNQGEVSGRPPNGPNIIPGPGFANTTAAHGPGPSGRVGSNFSGVTRGVLNLIEPKERHAAYLAEAERCRAQLEQQGYRFEEAMPFPVTRLRGTHHTTNDPPSTEKKTK